MKREKRGTKKRVILVDCSSVTYAAFHTVGHLSYDGQKTGIVYGFLSRILMMAEKFKTSDFILCWDAGFSCRVHAYPQYKQVRWAKREAMTGMEKRKYDSLLFQTLQLCHEVMPTMGFKNNFIKAEYEADDLLGHWVQRLSKYNYDVIMVTTDADMYQCLDRCRIWFPTKKKYFTEKLMIERYGGTTAKQWPLAKAIGGCSGDGVEGIVGASDPKKDSSKVHKYLRGELGKGKILDRIQSKEGQAIIARNLPLVTVPYREDILPKMIRRRNTFSRKQFIEVFDRFLFRSFLTKEKLKKWGDAFGW